MALTHANTDGEHTDKQQSMALVRVVSQSKLSVCVCANAFVRRDSYCRHGPCGSAGFGTSSFGRTGAFASCIAASNTMRETRARSG